MAIDSSKAWCQHKKMKYFLILVSFNISSFFALEGKAKSQPENSNPKLLRQIELEQSKRREQMLVHKKLYVNVQTDQLKNKSEELVMEAEGIVAAPYQNTLKIVTDYSQLKDVSGHFRKVVYRKDNQRLYLLVGAMGYVAQLWMQLKENQDKEEVYRLDWVIDRGKFKGMQGQIIYEPIGFRHTRIQMKSKLQAKKLPLPPIISRLALEVLSHRVASRMRTYIETQSKKPK